MKKNIEAPENQTPVQKMVWQSPELKILSHGYIKGGANPAHFEHSFHQKSTSHGVKYGTVDNEAHPHASPYATGLFPYNTLHHS